MKNEKVVLVCSECSQQKEGSLDTEFMNKIVMWNHVKAAHPRMADRIMRMYKTVPNILYSVRPIAEPVF